MQVDDMGQASFETPKKFQTDVNANGVPHKFIEDDNGNINLQGKLGILVPVFVEAEYNVIESKELV